MNGRKDRVEAVFQAANELRSPTEREAYLKRECGEDKELRREVEELLKAAVEAEQVFETRGSAPALEKVGSRIGHYHLLQKIGEGGCGVVYMAEQETPVRRKVALKIVKVGMDTRQVIARFEAERQALALMDHPNIAKVLDAGATQTGRPYFVMELVRGRKITESCDEQRFSTVQRLEVFIQVCHAVQHAHQKGIIHRDLKPSNILVTERDGVPVAKVIDFGIAKAIGGLLLTDKTLFTAFEQFLGTPAYMSPEQARLGELDIDTRSDLYSLGVLLYELLTGQTPFDAGKLRLLAIEEVLKTIREADPPPPSNRLTTMTDEQRTAVARSRKVEPSVLPKLVRGDLDWIVMKCLEKDRTRRYETANGLGLDVQRHMDSEPVTARPPSNIYRFQRLVRRNKLTFAAVGAIAMALLVGFGISMSLFLQERQTRRRAVAAEQGQRHLLAIVETNAAELAEKVESKRRTLYRFEIAVAQKAHQEGNTIHLKQLLQECPQDLRSWEWRRLNYLSDRSIFTLKPAAGQESWWISGVAFSPDGTRVASGEGGLHIRVWDWKEKRQLAVLSLPPQQYSYVSVPSVVFSPDGRFLAAAGDGGVVKIWDAKTYQERLVLNVADLLFPGAKYQSITGMIFSPDGNKIIVSISGVISIWDVSTGSELQKLEAGQDVYRIVLSPSGQRLAAVGSKGTIQVWSLQVGKVVGELQVGGDASAVTWSPDGNRIAAGGGRIRILDADTLQELKVLEPHATQVGVIWNGTHALAFNAGGTELAAGNQDGTIQIWDTQSWKQLALLHGHSGWVSSIAYSPDGKMLVSGGGQYTGNKAYDYELKVWDAFSSPDTEILENLGRGYDPTFCFSPDSHLLASSCGSEVNVWNVPISQKIFKLSGDGTSIRSVAFSPDGKWIAAGSGENVKPFGDCGIRVWSADSAALIAVMPGHTQQVSSLSFSPDGTRIVSGSWDGSVRIWRIPDAKVLMTAAPRKKGSRVYSVEFSPDGSQIAVGRQGGTEILDASNGSLMRELSVEQWSPVTCVAWSPDGKCIASAGYRHNAMIKLWDVQTGLLLRKLSAHTDEVTWIAFSPDGTRVASCGYDGRVLLWDASTGSEIINLSEKLNVYSCVKFSPDGNTLAASERGGSVLLWETSSSETNLMQRHFANLNRVRMGISQRPSTASPDLIDLSYYFNAGFRGNWHGQGPENDLSLLPTGVQTLEGIAFDVRGLIQVGNINEVPNRFPQEVLGIPVGRSCRLLHILHAAINAGNETSAKAGETIGAYKLHYASGQIREIPIVLGKDVMDWWSQTNEILPSAGGPVVAWTGTNGESRRENRNIRLFKTDWENPLPDDKVETIDFVSTQTMAKPFLVAITVEQ